MQKDITVTTFDGHEPGETIGRDELTDLAFVIKVD